jgi:hypothetical protein
MFITSDILYRDLAFHHKLKLFRASTTPGVFFFLSESVLILLA